MEILFLASVRNGRINREMELLQEVSSMPILRKYPD